MLSKKKYLILFDVKSVQDIETGDRRQEAENVSLTVAEKNLVGIQTQQLGQLQNVKLQYSLDVNMMYFNEQNYVYLDEKVYEIASVSPAKLPQNVKLNVARNSDNNIENAIKEWINGNLQ